LGTLQVCAFGGGESSDALSLLLGEDFDAGYAVTHKVTTGDLGDFTWKCLLLGIEWM
jgi:hypothetical protein